MLLIFHLKIILFNHERFNYHLFDLILFHCLKQQQLCIYRLLQFIDQFFPCIKDIRTENTQQHQDTGRNTRTKSKTKQSE
jgi:hypothetical protein